MAFFGRTTCLSGLSKMSYGAVEGLQPDPDTCQASKFDGFSNRAVTNQRKVPYIPINTGMEHVRVTRLSSQSSALAAFTTKPIKNYRYYALASSVRIARIGIYGAWSLEGHVLQNDAPMTSLTQLHQVCTYAICKHFHNRMKKNPRFASCKRLLV